MAHPHDLSLLSLVDLYATSPYACSYLPGRMARSQVAVPPEAIDARFYGLLVQQGFRRSGPHVYRPWCDACQACVSVRLRAMDFVPARRHRRAMARHRDLKAIQYPLLFRDEHYALYLRYQMRRHAGSGMDEDSRAQYTQFMLMSHVDSRLIEFRAGRELRMVSLIDILPDGLSAVYTFYDPDVAGSLGTYAILWQIAHCRHWGLPYLYLGYWIADCRKMAYKADYRPLEALRGGRWQPFVPKGGG